MDKASRDAACTGIIRNHLVWSMGLGLIPVPVADIMAVSAVQLDMVRQLSRMYEVDFKETEGKALIATLMASSLAKFGAQVAVKLIPGVGSVVGGVAMSVLSGASTYATGQVFREHFETGGTFLDFDPNRLRKYYQEQFEKGKKVAKDIKDQEERGQSESPKAEGFFGAPPAPSATPPMSNDALLEKLKELAMLKQQGILTDEEFQKMKARLLAQS